MTPFNVISFGGQSWDATSGGSPIEIWSCSLSTISPVTPTQAAVDVVAALVLSWFGSDSAGIASTESLDWVKLNTFDADTGHQVTDPTVIHEYTPGANRGDAFSTNPITMAYRISLDDGTRNPRHRGGFFPPRAGHQVGPDARWSETDTTHHLEAAVELLQAINGLGGFDVGVWSRADQNVFPVSRVRVSDVPDDISRRKNNLRPAYQDAAL